MKHGQSPLEYEAQRIQETESRKERMRPTPPFEKSEMGREATERRIKECEDFAKFKINYFPPKVHKMGYFPDNRMIKELPDIMSKLGANMVGGPRGYAKSATARMYYAYELIIKTDVDYLGVYAADETAAESIMRNLYRMIFENPRILHDYSPELLVVNKDEIRFRLPGHANDKVIINRSSRQSARGRLELFTRFDRVLVDDLENEQMPNSFEAIEKRWQIIQSARTAMNPENGILTFLCNVFSTESLAYKLIEMDADNQLPHGWTIHLFKAWDDEQGGPLWPERFPARAENELMAIHGVSEDVWAGDYQQEPLAKGGRLFPKEHVKYYDEIPDDARGIRYADTQLARKLETSDTTAMLNLLYSPGENVYYVTEGVCKPYSSVDDLLTDYLNGYDRLTVRYLGMDGHVNQAANWGNFIQLWARTKGRIPPEIHFRSKRTDEIAMTAASLYQSGRILFSRQWLKTDQGERAMKQLWQFTSKRDTKGNKKDDFPDALIQAVDFINEIKLGEVRYPKPKVLAVTDIDTYF